MLVEYLSLSRYKQRPLQPRFELICERRLFRKNLLPIEIERDPTFPNQSRSPIPGWDLFLPVLDICMKWALQTRDQMWTEFLEAVVLFEEDHEIPQEHPWERTIDLVESIR